MVKIKKLAEKLSIQMKGGMQVEMDDWLIDLASRSPVIVAHADGRRRRRRIGGSDDARRTVAQRTVEIAMHRRNGDGSGYGTSAGDTHPRSHVVGGRRHVRHRRLMMHRQSYAGHWRRLAVRCGNVRRWTDAVRLRHRTVGTRVQRQVDTTATTNTAGGRWRCRRRSRRDGRQGKFAVFT